MLTRNNIICRIIFVYLTFRCLKTDIPCFTLTRSESLSTKLPAPLAIYHLFNCKEQFYPVSKCSASKERHWNIRMLLELSTADSPGWCTCSYPEKQGILQSSMLYRQSKLQPSLLPSSHFKAFLNYHKDTILADMATGQQLCSASPSKMAQHARERLKRCTRSLWDNNSQTPARSGSELQESSETAGSFWMNHLTAQLLRQALKAVFRILWVLCTFSKTKRTSDHKGRRH